MKTYEQHRERHVQLHRELDELVADWIGETDSFPSGCTVMELMMWSHEQTVMPADRHGRFGKEGDDMKAANVELTGAARLYRAASSDRRERG